MAVASIDPRKLQRLAATARKAGITRLVVNPDGSCEFDLGPPPAAEVPARRMTSVPSPVPDARPPTWSKEGMRRRFARGGDHE
jgi:hypothetical protein